MCCSFPSTCWKGKANPNKSLGKCLPVVDGKQPADQFFPSLPRAIAKNGLYGGVPHGWVRKKTDKSLWTSVQVVAHCTFHCFLSSVPNPVFFLFSLSWAQKTYWHIIFGVGWNWWLWDLRTVGWIQESEHTLWGSLRFILVWITKTSATGKATNSAGTILRETTQTSGGRQTYFGFLPLRKRPWLT